MKTPASDSKRTIILAINDVEAGLVKTLEVLSEELGRKLSGIVLIDKSHVESRYRNIDESNTFKEIIVDFDDVDELQKVLKPYQKTILAATCRHENGIQYLRKVVPLLPYVNLPTEQSLQWATEKDLMRNRLTTHNPELGPLYKRIDHYDEGIIQEVLSDMKFPVIVKPIGLCMSILVTKCDNEADLRTALKNTFTAIRDTYERDKGRGSTALLIEEMIQGDMYSIDAYVNETGDVYDLPLIRTITAHEVGHEGFYSYKLDSHVELDEKQRQAARDVATDAIHALHLRSTTTHIELFHTRDGWKIIELGPRIGGYREDLYREVYGIEHYYNDIAVRIGLEPKINTTPLRYAAGVNIYAEEEGVIESIDGFPEAQKLGSVVYLKQHMQPGEQALFAGNGGRYIVDGILSNDDKSQLDHDVDEVRELIDIRTKNK